MITSVRRLFRTAPLCSARGTNQMLNAAAIFERDRYVILPSLLQEPRLGQFFRYTSRLASSGMMQIDSEQVPGAPFVNGDFMMEGLLESLRPQVELASGLRLYPTYSLVRVYNFGDVLAKHRDRPACEISITLCLGFAAGEPWPIWIEGPHGTSSVRLRAGDGLLYRGTECPHWREAFQGQHHVQVFLHYVDQNGPHADWRFDKRQSLTEIMPGQ